jgi:hypothetical protein
MKKGSIGGLVLCTLAVAAPGLAQSGFTSEGEASSVLACFYECKEQRGSWVELTTLMLTNQRSQTVFAQSGTLLTPEDLDEVNICETLLGGGVKVPQAGLVEVVILGSVPPFAPTDGTYAWVKNLTGRFKKGEHEPFKGQVTGVGKTECRVVPSSVTTAAEVRARNAPIAIPAILVEDTEDPAPCAQCGDGNLHGRRDELQLPGRLHRPTGLRASLLDGCARLRQQDLRALRPAGREQRELPAGLPHVPVERLA